jgi:hypothetical protein
VPIAINPFTTITALDPDFVSIINDQLIDTSLDAPEIVALNFRDPTYSAEHGGYHPVEIHVDSTGDILCVTDFAYVGIPPFHRTRHRTRLELRARQFSSIRLIL